MNILLESLVSFQYFCLLFSFSEEHLSINIIICTLYGWVPDFCFGARFSENQQERFMIQIMPAVYFLTILAIQNIWKASALLSVGDFREFGKLLLTGGYWLFKRVYSTAVRWFSFFPLRYYLCGFVIAYLSLSYLPYMIDAEEEALHRIFKFFGIKSFFVYGQLHAVFLDSNVARYHQYMHSLYS